MKVSWFFGWHNLLGDPDKAVATGLLLLFINCCKGINVGHIFLEDHHISSKSLHNVMSVWYVLSEVNRKVQVSELYWSLLVFDSCNVQLEPKHVTVPSHQTYITDIIMMLNGFLDSTAVNHKQSEIQIHPGWVIHNRTSHSIGDREILIDVKTVDYFRSPPCGPWKS